MELKDFISETISAICDGIADAKVKTNGKYQNCIVAPGHINGVATGNDEVDRFTINFELCVTSDESDEKKAEVGAKIINVITFDINGNTKSNVSAHFHLKCNTPKLT